MNQSKSWVVMPVILGDGYYAVSLPARRVILGGVPYVEVVWQGRVRRMPIAEFARYNPRHPLAVVVRPSGELGPTDYGSWVGADRALFVRKDGSDTVESWAVANARRINDVHFKVGRKNSPGDVAWVEEIDMDSAVFCELNSGDPACVGVTPGRRAGPFVDGGGSGGASPGDGGSGGAPPADDSRPTSDLIGPAVTFPTMVPGWPDLWPEAVSQRFEGGLVWVRNGPGGISTTVRWEALCEANRGRNHPVCRLTPEELPRNELLSVQMGDSIIQQEATVWQLDPSTVVVEYGPAGMRKYIQQPLDVFRRNNPAHPFTTGSTGGGGGGGGGSGGSSGSGASSMEGAISRAAQQVEEVESQRMMRVLLVAAALVVVGVTIGVVAGVTSKRG